jgi:ribosomal protein S18 acetylase RimI-like enzyme
MIKPSHLPEGLLRPLRAEKDLSQVADLIELCFKGSIDEDGTDYIRYLRNLARTAKDGYWGLGSIQRRYAAIQGFVYEVEGKIVGNLSMLPFHKNGDFVYLIANVAVHPDYRRQGIALNLTTDAFKYAKSKSANSVWLQVRDDNPPAFLLYKKMGFFEKTRRTTWTLKPHPETLYPYQTDVRMVARKAHTWSQQKEWLLKNYDDNVRWNLGLKTERLKPGFLAWIDKLINERTILQYAAYLNHQWLGTLTLEKTNLFADNLWISADPDWEDQVIRTGIPFLQRKSGHKRPITVNFPENRAVSAFEFLGFEKNHTLIWMQASTHIPVIVQT